MAVSGRVDLAHEPDFVLGRLTVSPSRRELVRDDGEREVIEHRVMQVLVALVRAEGNIVTRDELTMSCWDGRVVGEDAIHRVMSLLRKVANGIGAGSIDIETITKVGYRLTSNGQGDGSAGAGQSGVAAFARMPSARQTRRGMLVGAAGAIAAAGAATLLYRRLTAPRVPPEVEPLVTQARQLRDQGTREAHYQAIGLLRRVVAMAPDYADGWGMLGCAYAIPSHYQGEPEGQYLRTRAEAAARRAFALDPGNAYGELALSITLPFIGHWRERDRRLDRALARRPTDGEMLNFRAVQLIFVGRSSEAVRYFEKMRERPFTPARYHNYIVALWNAGRIEERDRAVEDAAALYPTQATIWSLRFSIGIFGGNPEAAIALAEDAKGLPTNLGTDRLEVLLGEARAIQSGNPAEVNSVMAKQFELARRDATAAEFAIRVACALGRIDEAFTIASAYYFGRGFIVPDFATADSPFTPNQRGTRLLFEPVTRPMRNDARFEPMVAEIGLDRYWRESRVQPDYRRRA